MAILLGLAILLGSLYFGAAAVVYSVAASVPADCDGNYVGYSPADWSPPRWATDFDPAPYLTTAYEPVTIPSRDAGIELNGWWLPADDPSAPAIVVVHGRGGCVRHPEVLAPAGMLQAHGYSVLLIDLRDHGASTIEDGYYAGGMEEYRDVMGAVDWLIAHGVPAQRIGALGTSMGAATVIIAAGEDERIAAVWADSSYADLERRMREDLEQRGLPTFVVPAANVMARLISGDDFTSHRVLDEVVELDGRDLFIAHGALDDATYVSHAHELLAAAQAAGVDADMWVDVSAGHVDSVFLSQDEYEARVGAFFEGAFATS